MLRRSWRIPDVTKRHDKSRDGDDRRDRVADDRIPTDVEVRGDRDDEHRQEHQGHPDQWNLRKQINACHETHLDRPNDGVNSEHLSTHSRWRKWNNALTGGVARVGAVDAPPRDRHRWR